MRRRVLSIGSVLIAIAALVVVLANATLVDRRGPSVAAVSLSAPVEGQATVAHTLTAIDVQFSEPVRAQTVERRFRIQPYVAGTITWEGSTATFTPSDKLPADTEFTITIEAGFEDLAGNPAAEATDAFTFRTVGPPGVAAVEPANGTAGVPVDATVTITFDRLMDTSAVEEALRVEPLVALRPSWSGRTLSVDFGEQLAFGTTYRLTIGTQAADTGGSRLRAAVATEFTTVEAGLTVTGTLPADGVAGISIRTQIAVMFDGPVDPGTIQEALTITPSVGGALRVVPAPDDTAVANPGEERPGSVLAFQPSEPLAAHTTYTIEFDAVVGRAGAPDQVAPSRTWRFTTGQPTPSGHNQIAYLSARAGTRDVWLMNPDGSAPRQLTIGLAPVSAFDVALDGTQVAFAAGGKVRTMAIDGSGEAVITGDGRFEYAPRFSPDGRSLLIARREVDGSDAGWWLLPLGVGGGAERQVLASGAPPLGSTSLGGEGIEVGDGYSVWSNRATWDADGRWMAITDAAGDVHLVDLEAGEPLAPAIRTGLTASSPAGWDAASARFLIVAGLRGAPQEGLWEIRPDGQVNQDGDAAGSLSVSPHGSVALLVRSSAGVAHVAVRTAPRPQPLTRGDGLADRWPAFSPDGETVVFGRVFADDGTTSAGIWTIDAAGGPPVALTTDGAYPRWLP